MLCACLLGLCPAFLGDLEVVVAPKQGIQDAGTITIESFTLETATGPQTIAPGQLRWIEFGDTDTVILADGKELAGKLALDSIDIVTKDYAHHVHKKPKLAWLGVPHRATPEAGKVVEGMSKNGLMYHLRMPEGWSAKAKTTFPAVVFFHGSNMNSRDYVETAASAWPSLPENRILIGIDGEQRNPRKAGEPRTYNYTYVNFVGESTYQGFPGTDRESPALVAEALAELKSFLPISKTFVGGHSQGGFLTYSVFMNYPQLVDGAFAVSAGLIVQAEPSAYARDTIREAQRRNPIAIVHGENDPLVEFSMARYAYEAFDDEGFPRVHFFASQSAAHMFGLLPVDDAIRWLERHASDDPQALLAFAEASVKSGETRDALAALSRAESLDKAGKLKAKIAPLRKKLGDEAAAKAKPIEAAIKANKDGAWVDGFLAFRSKYALSDGAKGALAAYATLREQHQKPAEAAVTEGRAEMQKGNKDSGYAKYETVVKQYYASSWFRVCRAWLTARKP